jgi:hypothetical protein
MLLQKQWIIPTAVPVTKTNKISAKRVYAAPKQTKSRPKQTKSRLSLNDLSTIMKISWVLFIKKTNVQNPLQSF